MVAAEHFVVVFPFLESKVAPSNWHAGDQFESNRTVRASRFFFPLPFAPTQIPAAVAGHERLAASFRLPPASAVRANDDPRPLPSGAENGDRSN